MTETEKRERIAKMQAEYGCARDEANRLEIALAEAQDDMLRADWLRLLYDSTCSAEDRQRAYVRVQARNVLGCPSAIQCIDTQDRDEVLAEVERMKAGRAEAGHA